jgi:hypothetical protein
MHVSKDAVTGAQRFSRHILSFHRKESAMKTPKRVLVLAGLIAVVLLVPALIWSGKQVIDITSGAGSVKLPEVSTVGPEMMPYVLTPLEREKLTSPVYPLPSSLDTPASNVLPAIVTGDGPYEGMTQAELDKLAVWRSGRVGAFGQTPARTVSERERQGGDGHE